MNGGWRANIDQSDDHLRRWARVAIWRDLGEGRVEVVNGDGTRSVYEPDVYVPRDNFITVPMGALVAIRDAIDEQMGRRVDEKQLEEVRSTLAVERGRLDKVLDAFLRTER